jgi:hypothetical protein
MSTLKQVDPSKPSSAAERMRPRVKLINTLMAGTDALREAGEEYLPKHPAESDKNYRERLARGVLVNYFRRCVESLVGKPFSNPIVLGDDMPQQLRELSEDVDRQGNNIDVFAKNCFRESLAKGIVHILVEYPNTETANVQTMEDEAAIAARPYFVMIPHENVLAAYCEHQNGQEVLTHLRLWEEEIVRDGFDEKVIQRVRVIDRGTWELWRKVAKNRWEIESSGTYSLPYIPLVTYYSDREEFMIARPPLTDLAHVNLAHWQSSSDQINILTVARFPMLAGSGLDEDESQLEIGPRKLLTTKDSNGKYYYVEHSGAAIGAGRDNLKDLEEQMSVLGVELLKKTGTVTATAKAIDSAENLSMLQCMAISFADAIEMAYGIAAEWMGLGRDKGGSIGINTDFSLKLDDPNDLSTLSAARTAREISHEAYIKELKRRKVLADDYDVVEDALLLKTEKEQAMVDAAFQVQLENEGVLPPGKKPKEDDEEDEE